MGDEKVEQRPIIGITLDIDGEYLKLKRHYPPAIRKAGGIPLLIPHGNDPRVMAGIIDGLLIPGGGDIDPSYYLETSISRNDTLTPHATVSMERTEFEIALLRAIMELRKPVLGICYGMQLINVAFGGSLYQDIGDQSGMFLDHRKGSHRIVGKGSLLKGEFTVNSSHHQAVRRIGNGLSPCAFSDDKLVEALELTGYPFLIGVQWHPERSDDILALNLLSAFVEAANVRK